MEEETQGATEWNWTMPKWMNDADWVTIIARLKGSQPEEMRQALEALWQRHPESLPQAWRELRAGGGLSAGNALPILRASAFLDKVGNPPPMLIEGLLPDKSLFLLSGKPKAGKSFLALDLAYAAQNGTNVFGTHRVNRPGPVVYLAMEDGETATMRLPTGCWRGGRGAGRTRRTGFPFARSGSFCPTPSAWTFCGRNWNRWPRRC